MMAAYADSVDDRILTEDDDFSEVKDAVYDLQARWRAFALALGLRPAQPDIIFAEHPGNVEKCMDKTILVWLRRAHNERKYGPPTWAALVKAVAHRVGGANPALAEKIAKDHPRVHVAELAPARTALQPPLVPHVISYTSEGDGEAVTISTYGIKMRRIFAHESAKQCTAIEFSFGTVQVKSGQQQQDLEAYKMQSHSHGICVIINNERFSSHSLREGTHIDEVNLTQCFRYLGYTVEVYREVTAHQIESIFCYYCRVNHTNSDSFVVCILSHGNDGHIFGTDSKSVELQTAVTELNAESSPTLAGKPKLFFIQACRGGNKVEGTTISSDSGEAIAPRSSEAVRVVSDSKPITIPDDADFFFGNATPPGKVAWRDMDHGSWYVSEICSTFVSLARYTDLVSMITKVHNEVGTCYENMNYRQAPEASTRLRKKVFFF